MINNIKIFNQDILFDQPNILWLLVIVLIHIIWYIFLRKGNSPSIKFSNLSLFESKKNLKEKLVYLPYILRLIATSLIIISISEPFIKEESIRYLDIEESQEISDKDSINVIDIMIALDVSGSMLAKDFKPNRLHASKDIAIDFINDRINDRIGIVVFAGEAFTQSPLTNDHLALINLFNKIEFGMINDGTAIGDAIANSVNRLKDEKIKTKIIILITDGENTAGSISPEMAADIAKNKSIKIYTIGVGTKGMAKMPVAYDLNGKFIYDYMAVKIDEKSLKKIANVTGGKYFRATNNESMKRIYEEINQLETTKIEDENDSYNQDITYVEHKKVWQYHIYTFLALILFTVSFILNKIYFRRLI